MTFNLRVGGRQDCPPHAWPQRCQIASRLIQASDPDIIGTQEGTYGQLRDLRSHLQDYDWIGLGRGGGSRGEFMAVFYRPTRLEPVEFDHFWLSDAPTTAASITWGNRWVRMVTWVRFHDRRTDRGFYVLNTHLDYTSAQSREQSAQLILDRVRTFDPQLPVLITGDFGEPASSGIAHRRLVGTGEFRDTWREAITKGPEVGTFHRYRGAVGGGERIDWMLVRGAMRTLRAEIVTYAENGEYPSDHYPVIAQLEWQSGDRRDHGVHGQGESSGHER
ncbi:endonuclease [Candidatus Poribacteria bacterium]|nr:endonuclease [Candidatus Poribacteria bacterium]